jgi:hypothetical protein
MISVLINYLYPKLSVTPYNNCFRGACRITDINSTVLLQYSWPHINPKACGFPLPRKQNLLVSDRPRVVHFMCLFFEVGVLFFWSAKGMPSPTTPKESCSRSYMTLSSIFHTMIIFIPHGTNQNLHNLGLSCLQH